MRPLARRPVSHPSARLPSLSLLGVLSCLLTAGWGCGSIAVEGIDGFSAMSELWLVQTSGTTRRHRLVLSNVGDHCRKLRNAEQGRIDADRRNGERLAADDPFCESTDLWYDDMADAYGPVEKKGAKLLEVTLERDGVGESLDSQSAPAPGSYCQFCSNGDGEFEGQLRYFGGDFWGRSADAWTCVTPEDEDAEQWAAFQDEDLGDLRDIWNLSAGSVDISGGGEDSWDVQVEAGIIDEGEDTVGSLKAEFTAGKCEVEVSEDVL